MRKIIAIGLAVALAAMAAPVAAHTEDNPEACNEDKDPCNNRESHRACVGTRDWFDKGNQESLSMLGIQIAEEPEEIGVYIHAPPHPNENDGGTLGLEQAPGVLWMETNGFSSLQKADWSCQSIEHEDKDEWVEHPDRVII